MTDETQTNLTASQAAKLVGKSIPTITRAIKNGTLTAKPRKPKGWVIEPVELFRVFDPATDVTNIDGSMLVNETSINNSVLQAKLEVMEQRFSDAQATIEDLRNRLDAESAERRQLTAQLTDQRQQVEPQKRGLWARLFGA